MDALDAFLARLDPDQDLTTWGSSLRTKGYTTPALLQAAPAATLENAGLPRPLADLIASSKTDAPTPSILNTLEVISATQEVMSASLQKVEAACSVIIAPMFEWTASESSRGSNAPFKQQLLKVYDLAEADGNLCCMVTGIVTRCTAAHLLMHRQKPLARMFGLSNLDSARNGVIAAHILEKAFDNSLVSFLPTGETLTTYVIDRRLLGMRLGQDIPEDVLGRTVKALGCEAVGRLLWDELHKTPWAYPFTRATLPKTSALYAQFHSAVRRADRLGVLNVDLEVTKLAQDIAWSEEKAQQQVQKWMPLPNAAVIADP